jgi:uncharacterized protein YjbI with pentapeptide repeats
MNQHKSLTWTAFIALSQLTEFMFGNLFFGYKSMVSAIISTIGPSIGRFGAIALMLLGLTLSAIGLDTSFHTPPAHAAASTAAAGSLSEFENGGLEGKDFSGQGLAGAQFANARLAGTNFSQANLIGAVFSTSTLNGTIFRGADLTQAIFDQVRLNNVDFSNAVLNEALLLRTEFANTTIAGADFTDTLLTPLQVKEFCKVASGQNPTTGVDTRESLGCRD